MDGLFSELPDTTKPADKYDLVLSQWSSFGDFSMTDEPRFFYIQRQIFAAFVQGSSHDRISLTLLLLIMVVMVVVEVA